MKLSFLSKTLSTIGLMAALSVVIGSSLQSAAKAQIGAEADSQAQRDAQAQAVEACLIEAMGGNSFYEFQGIEFSPEQEEAFRQAEAELSEKSARQAESLRTETAFDGAIDVFAYDSVHIDMLQAAADVIRRDQIPNSLQIDALNEQYGQYGGFDMPVTFLFTQEQLNERDRIDRDFEATMLAAFTPEQQQVYQDNLVIKRAMAACDLTPVDD